MFPNAYIEYLVHFHGDRDYFECHEILEDFWKSNPKKDKNSIWVGFILLAVSNYHYRRGNHNGAFKTLKKAISIFQNKKPQAMTLGIDIHSLLTFLSERIIHIKSHIPYRSFNLPIKDDSLLMTSREICHNKGYKWGNDSDMNNPDLIHRHLTRDRTGVFQERENARSHRKNKKGRE
jgi:uncharacterized protein